MANRRSTRLRVPPARFQPADAARPADPSRDASPARGFEAPQVRSAAPVAQAPGRVDRAARAEHSLGALQIFDESQTGGADRPGTSQEGVRQALGNGRPLDESLRTPLEGMFRTDFSDVVVHTDEESADLSRSLSARAFTSGSDIFFGDGAYDPSSASGRELLVHELTHVVQQGAGAGPTSALEVSHPSDASELEAASVARRVAAAPPSAASGLEVGADAGAGAAIQRDFVADVVQDARELFHDVAEGVGLESPEDAEAGRLQAFIDRGTFGPESLVPPTNTGGFDASFNPQTNVLLIEVRTGINFVDGLAMDASNVVTANHTDIAQAAIDAMSLPAADRAAFVEQFTWTDPVKAAFSDQLQSRVEDSWSGQYMFMCTRPGWASMFAGVALNVVVHEGAAGDGDHLQTTTYKVPDGGAYNVGAFVQSHADQDPFNNELVMSSTHVDETPLDRSLLRKTVLFAHDSAALTPDAQAILNAFERDFQDANLDMTNPVELVGHASSPGTEEYNLRLGQRRIDAVRDYLAGIGFTGINERVTTQNVGEEGATEDPEWRRVDLTVGSGEGQLVASHEFGHVFGLSDEYVSNDVNPGGSIRGSGSPVGTAVGHDAMARAIGTSGAIAENNDDIMSLGNTVRPKHYATFGWALAQVTGIDEWVVV